MSNRLFASVLIAGLTAVAAGCSNDSPTTPTNVPPKFSASLSPANEVPAISNADQTGSGSATITFNLTKDSAGNITAATADFSVNLSGFPAGTTLTGAHIHPGVAGTTGGVIVNTGLASGEVTLANGSGSFSKNGITVDPALAQGILNAPANYYFNVHTTLNTGGAARAQLVRTQ